MATANPLCSNSNSNGFVYNGVGNHGISMVLPEAVLGAVDPLEASFSEKAGLSAF
jgi:hypothetical protein